MTENEREKRPDAILIREIKKQDLEEVAAIEESSIQQPWPLSSFEEAAFLPHTLFLVAEQSGCITGYIGCYFSYEEAEISGIAVSPSCRRRGIGDALLLEAEMRLKERNVEHLVLEVRRSNTGAQAFYEKNGFRKIGERKNMYDFPKEDAFVMERELK